LETLEQQVAQYNTNIYNFANSYLQTLTTTATGVLAVTATLIDPVRHPRGIWALHVSWTLLLLTIVLSLLSQVSYILGSASQIRLIMETGKGNPIAATPWQKVVFLFVASAGLTFAVAVGFLIRFAIEN
jgi:hypothetical protein